MDSFVHVSSGISTSVAIGQILQNGINVRFKEWYICGGKKS